MTWPGPLEHDLERRARRVERMVDLGVALVVLGIALAVLL